jgi:hypothetical protein
VFLVSILAVLVGFGIAQVTAVIVRRHNLAKVEQTPTLTGTHAEPLYVPLELRKNTPDDHAVKDGAHPRRQWPERPSILRRARHAAQPRIHHLAPPAADP